MPKPNKRQSNLIWIGKLVSEAQAKEFYGKLTIHFEKGSVTRVINEQSLKPPKDDELD